MTDRETAQEYVRRVTAPTIHVAMPDLVIEDTDGNPVGVGYEFTIPTFPEEAQQ